MKKPSLFLKTTVRQISLLIIALDFTIRCKTVPRKNRNFGLYLLIIYDFLDSIPSSFFSFLDVLLHMYEQYIFYLGNVMSCQS